MDKKDNYNHIQHATNELLALYIEDVRDFLEGTGEFKSTNTRQDIRVILTEAARRLRIPPYPTFNDEAFDM